MKTQILKKGLLFIIVCTLNTVFYGQELNWLVGGGGHGMERAWDLAKSSDNDIFVTGQYTDTLYIEGDVFSINGFSDVFVVKYNNDGEYQWYTVFGCDEETVALSIDCDSHGNTFVSGYFTGQFDVLGESHFASGWDIYIIKIDTNGNIVDFTHPEGIESELGYGLAVGKDNRVIITGWFQSTLTFSEVDSITSYGGSDVFIASYDENLNFEWAANAGSEAIEYGFKIAADQLGNCYVTGVAGPDANFGGILLGGEGTFVAKYNEDGEVVGLNYHTAAVNSISVNSEGKGFVAGRVTGNAYFPGDEPMNISSVDDTDDGYVASFDENLNWQWVRTIKGEGMNKGRAVYCDENHNAFWTGNYQGNFTIGEEEKEVKSEDDGVFIAKFDQTGRLEYTRTSEGDGSDASTDIIQIETKVITTGWYTTEISFEELSLNTVGIDYFLVSYDENVGVLDHFSASSDDVSIYPNPAENIISVKFEKYSGSVSYIIYDEMGRVVTTNILNGSNTIQVTNFYPGIYHLKMNNGNKVYNIKFLKN